MQGLQRNVIGMAFCCKKSVGTSERQLGMNLVPTKSHSNYMGTTVYHGPNVIWLWWPVLNSGLLDGTDQTLCGYTAHTIYHCA
ncbi:hypothetical protein JV483_003235 [Escherichia coli]|jgi:hypothetical protein|uniref:hypothetical protein n=1 Tax=Enterobacter hormaechei TaxID=158836 RepID=UPI000DF93A6F|nr:hypothetical protein [Enterobacter hormaechei]EHB7665309.1 hypothetical protein [Escherichia coli]MDY7153687.1 hypothetical protein [Enterobacter hormaechei]QLS11326.1 hypothetical protein HV326_15920 [Enterobacter hormaechei]STP69270.1 Uncharacterised protein [Enterobacter hormaechei]STQ06081.1 Uncharacterised protein [Enterobacter hormaechei]